MLCESSVTKISEGTIQKERYTIIKEPGSQYVDHVTPDARSSRASQSVICDDGSARSIASELISCIIETNSERYSTSCHL